MSETKAVKVKTFKIKFLDKDKRWDNTYIESDTIINAKIKFRKFFKECVISYVREHLKEEVVSI